MMIGTMLSTIRLFSYVVHSTKSPGLCRSKMIRVIIFRRMMLLLPSPRRSWCERGSVT